MFTKTLHANNGSAMLASLILRTALAIAGGKHISSDHHRTEAVFLRFSSQHGDLAGEFHARLSATYNTLGSSDLSRQLNEMLEQLEGCQALLIVLEDGLMEISGSGRHAFDYDSKIWPSLVQEIEGGNCYRQQMQDFKSQCQESVLA
jgi:hypothetical protein